MAPLPIVAPTDEASFEKMMRAVDAHLSDEGRSPAHRPLRAVLAISSTFKMGLPVIPIGAEAQPGVYTGEDLAIRIHKWYEDNYAGKLGLPIGLGRVALHIRGNAWAADFPRVWGTAHIVLDTTRPPDTAETHLGTGSSPVLNVLDYLDGLPPAVRRTLSVDEQKALFESWMTGYYAMSALSKLLSVKLGREILSDIEASVRHLVDLPAHYGQSRWSSMQAGEKALKMFIREFGGTPKSDHKVLKHADEAVSRGLQPYVRTLSQRIECSAGMRYGDVTSTLEEACQAHWAAVELVGLASTAVLALKPKP